MRANIETHVYVSQETREEVGNCGRSGCQQVLSDRSSVGLSRVESSELIVGHTAALSFFFFDEHIHEDKVFQ